MLVLLAASACGSGEDRPRQVVATPPADERVPVPVLVDTYEAVTNVSALASVGDHLERIRERLEDDPVPWTEIEEIWQSADLARIADVPEPGQFVEDAIAAGGPVAHVDFGLDVLLAERVKEELAAAEATGQVSEVDEAWAAFTAGGEGPARLEVAVAASVIDALEHCQRAAVSDDTTALAQATVLAAQRLNAVFDTAIVGRIEDNVAAQTLYRAVGPEIMAAEPAADRAILTAIRDGDRSAARSALSRFRSSQVGTTS